MKKIIGMFGRLQGRREIRKSLEWYGFGGCLEKRGIRKLKKKKRRKKEREIVVGDIKKRYVENRI